MANSQERYASLNNLNRFKTKHDTEIATAISDAFTNNTVSAVDTSSKLPTSNAVKTYVDTQINTYITTVLNTPV